MASVPCRWPTPVSENGQVIPRPTAWPSAVRFTTSDPLISPLRLALTFTRPPHRAETLPDTAVADRLEICHWRFVHDAMFGNPPMTGDAHVPAAAAAAPAAAVVTVDDPLEVPDGVAVEGAVGSRTSVLF